MAARRDGNDSSVTALLDKHPAFRLIIEFLKDNFVTIDRVNTMLQVDMGCYFLALVSVLSRRLVSCYLDTSHLCE